jgi:hypothetical protein
VVATVRRQRADDRVVAVGLVGALAAIVLLRTALFGWSPVAPDDARYLFVGLSALAGDGPVTPSGDVFLLRSPVYPLILAGGSSIVGGDPLDGARAVALGLAIVCLIGAVRLGWLLGGAGGAAGTAIVLAAMPIVWRLVPTLRIDLPQTAGVLAILIAVWRPTTRRWAVGGVLFGLTILVKETVLPLALLPLALVGAETSRRVRTLAVVYLGSTLVAAGWWWIVVWLEAGVLFPLNALAVVAARDVGGALSIGRVTLLVGGIAVIGWAAMAARARSELGPRLLVIAGACLVPAAVYAAAQGLDARNYAGLAVLSSVALGVGGAAAVHALGSRVSSRRLLRASLLALLVVSVGGTVVAGQGTVGRPPAPGVADSLSAWLRANTVDGDRIAMTFKDREGMALRLFHSVAVAYLAPVRVDPHDDPASYLWLGLRDRQLFGYRRVSWSQALTDPRVRYLALSGPHPFHPAELLPDLVAARVPGLALVASLDGGAEHADVFTVDAGVLDLTPDAAPTHLSSDAALAWLDLAASVLGEDVAATRLLATRPTVAGDSLPVLLARLGACAGSSGPGSPVILRPAGTCGD